MEPSHDPSIPEAYAGQRDRSLNNDEYTSMNAATNERFLIVTESALEHASPSTRSILLGHSSSSLVAATLKNGQSLAATSICPNLRQKDGSIPCNFPSLVLNVSAVARGKRLSETFKMRRGNFASIRGCFKKDSTGKDLPWRPHRSDSVAKVAKVWEVAEEKSREQT